MNLSDNAPNQPSKFKTENFAKKEMMNHVFIQWQYCRDEPDLAANVGILGFSADKSTTDSFKIKEKITGQTSDNGRKDVETIVPLKYLSNFWRTL